MDDLIQLFPLEFTNGLIVYRKLKKIFIDFLLYRKDPMFTLTKYHSQSYEWNWKEWNHCICPSVAAVQQDRRKTKTLLEPTL